VNYKFENVELECATVLGRMELTSLAEARVTT
jgi:hypothetical protein